jgi:CRP-like cAMP-binding protein
MTAPGRIYERRVYPPGRVLTRSGAPVDLLFLIKSGRVRLRIEPDEREVVVGPGTVIGLADIIEGSRQPVFHADAETIGPTEVICLGAVETARDLAVLSPSMRVMLRAMLRAAMYWVETCQHGETEREAMLRRAERSLSLVLDPSADAPKRLHDDIRADDGFGFLP